MRGHLFYVWGREAAGQPVSKKRERKREISLFSKNKEKKEEEEEEATWLIFGLRSV
jgi:hypothetical protein